MRIANDARRSAIFAAPAIVQDEDANTRIVGVARIRTRDRSSFLVIPQVPFCPQALVALIHGFAELIVPVRSAAHDLTPLLVSRRNRSTRPPALPAKPGASLRWQPFIRSHCVPGYLLDKPDGLRSWRALPSYPLLDGMGTASKQFCYFVGIIVLGLHPFQKCHMGLLNQWSILPEAGLIVKGIDSHPEWVYGARHG